MKGWGTSYRKKRINTIENTPMHKVTVNEIYDDKFMYFKHRNQIFFYMYNFIYFLEMYKQI